MTYPELAEVHRKLADTYMYLDKIIEFKDHYHEKSNDLESDLREIKESYKAQLDNLQEQIKTQQDIIEVYRNNQAEWNKLIDERNNQISELTADNDWYEALMLSFDADDAIITLLDIIQTRIADKNQQGLGVNSEAKALDLLKLIDYKIAKIKDGYADEEDEEIAF